jgi:hypothetical protein
MQSGRWRPFPRVGRNGKIASRCLDEIGIALRLRGFPHPCRGSRMSSIGNIDALPFHPSAKRSTPEFLEDRAYDWVRALPAESDVTVTKSATRKFVLPARYIMSKKSQTESRQREQHF